MLACVILVGGARLPGRDSRPLSNGRTQEPPEALAGLPIAALDVLGQSVLHRTISRVQRAGVHRVAVLVDDRLSDLTPEPHARSIEIEVIHHSADLWYAAEKKMAELAHGAAKILVIRLGAYAEFDVGALLRFHGDEHQAVTLVRDAQGPLDAWVVSASYVGQREVRFQELMRRWTPVSAAPYRVHGYVNRLVNASDLRRLVVDAFLARCAIRPGGSQTKPGVWVEDGAQLHRSSRVVAPAYIGRRSRLRAGTLITRFSSLERDCRVDHGTVVEDASILANTRLGPGLDVTHAVVMGNTIVNLRHNVAVQINDPALAGSAFPPTTGCGFIRFHWLSCHG
jgi:NDP-sugar pyrophosphorylase family protein